MASLSNDPNGTRRILFYDTDGNRKTLRLGKITQRQGEQVKLRVEILLGAKRTGTAVDDETSRWVAGLSDDLHARLAKHGLVANRVIETSVSLGNWLGDYVSSRSDVKSSTAVVYGHTSRCLVAYFGTDKPLASITPGDCDDWRRWLAEHEELAVNTVRRRCGIARQFFRAAHRKRLLTDNPFADMKGVGVKANRTRDYFITRDEAAKVLQSCPTNEWRLLFALARFGGLRTPSEPLALKWADVDWSVGRMTIRSPKTAHHDGHESRVLPIFPEIRPYLEQAWDEAEEGGEYVITKTRNPAINLRTRLQAYIAKAGLSGWPKLWQNLRATCETELAERFPSHVVCEWLGHSQLVAQKHYLQTTDDHFATALEPATNSAPEAAQNAAQHAFAPSRMERTKDHYPQENPREKRRFATACDSVQTYSVGDEGFEPPTSSV
jgi:integrase